MRAGLTNVRYHTCDFLGYQAARPYDFVLCSRALEYFDDKLAFATHLAALLASGAEGLIVTKNPGKWLLRGLIGGTDPRPHHQGQVGVRELKDLLEAAGFSEIACYPAVVRVPVGRLARFAIGLTERLYDRLREARARHGAHVGARADRELPRPFQERMMKARFFMNCLHRALVHNSIEG